MQAQILTSELLHICEQLLRGMHVAHIQREERDGGYQHEHEASRADRQSADPFLAGAGCALALSGQILPARQSAARFGALGGRTGDPARSRLVRSWLSGG